MGLKTLALLACACGAQAHDGAHTSRGVGAVATNVSSNAFVAKSELTLLDGSRFVELAKLGQPLLVNFWGVECPPCIAELPLLAEFARQQPTWTVVLVSTDSAETARDFLRRRPLPNLPNLLILKAGANPRASLRAAGNASGGLPYTLATKPQLTAGEVVPKSGKSGSAQVITCFTQRGMLGADDLRAALASCSQ